MKQKITRNWVGYLTDEQYDFKKVKQPYGIPSTYLVRRFSLEDIHSVKVRVAVQGVYSFYVNGHLVNDDFMSQDVSEMKETIYYRDYDISRYLKAGKNALGFVLSDGWYASNLSLVGKNNFGDYPLKVFYQVRKAGEVILESDGDEVARDGAIRAADNQNGIIIDHNFDLGDFSSPDYDLSSFHPVTVYPQDIALKKSGIPPIKAFKTFQPKLVREGENFVIYDFAQNFAGVTHTVFKGNKGDKVEIYHGEWLKEDHDLFTANLRSALAKDTYILSGKGEEEFLPRHTYHGFRYIKIVYPETVKILKVEAVACFTKMKRTGYLHTDNGLVNHIYSNVLWSQRSNFYSIPTDCPQRDERMGWTGDAQVFSSTAMYNYDTHAFFKQYCTIMMDTMDRYSYGVPLVIPHFVHRWGSWDCKQGWSDAIIVIPYYLYLYYGDKAFLRKCLPYMKKYLAFVKKNRMKRGYYEGPSLSDWLSVFEVTDGDLYSQAYYAFDNELVSKIAHILNQKCEKTYHQNFLKAKEKFTARFVKENRLISDSQGAYILAYQFGLTDADFAKKNLIRKIEEYGHLTTGFHSTKFLLPQLCEFSRPDLAYSLLTNRRYPSWGYEISCGATTIWERWDSYRKDIGFNPDGMNSFNHYSLGSVASWMYSDMLGVKPVITDPGFHTSIIRPYFDQRVSKCEGKIKTKYGIIKIRYVIQDNAIDYEIEADERIHLAFDFVNKILSKEELEKNHYHFSLKY